MYHDNSHVPAAPGAIQHAAGAQQPSQVSGSAAPLAPQPRVGFGPARDIPDGLLDTVTALRVWVRNSESGGLMPYSRESRMVCEYAAALVEKGFVTTHLMRHPGGPVIYVVQRTRVPIRDGQL